MQIPSVVFFIKATTGKTNGLGQKIFQNWLKTEWNHMKSLPELVENKVTLVNIIGKMMYSKLGGHWPFCSLSLYNRERWPLLPEENTLA